MRSRIGLFAASTVLAVCSLVLTGCGPEEDSSADSPSSSAGSSQEESGGKGKESAGGSNEGSDGETTSGPSDGSNQKPDAPACTAEDTSVTIKTVSGSGKASVDMVNNGGNVCSVYGAPDVELKSSDDKSLNSKPDVAQGKKPQVVTLDSEGGVATADLTYETGPSSEGGSQDGVTCGDEAATALVSTDDATWEAEIRVTGKGGMVVCDEKATVSPFHP